jgi:asparagine synthase (glutamine-hydrolysing)
MCGLWSIFSNKGADEITKYIEQYRELYDKLQVRGPDVTNVYTDDKCHMVFHRLVVNDASDTANQPMTCNENKNLILMCNGEIYNHKELEHDFNLTNKLKSKSDCELILAVYNEYMYVNREKMSLNMVAKRLCETIEGEFAFMLYDKTIGKLIVARDDFGVRPLFIGTQDGENVNRNVMFSSELKGMDENEYNVTQFKPGHYMILDLKTLNIDQYSPYIRNHQSYLDKCYTTDTITEILDNIRDLVTKSVIKRIENADFPVCSLLSGGLDSSLVAAIASRHLKAHGKVLETYAIGLEGAPDLHNAQIVADHIGSKHTSVVMTKEEFLDGIDETIRVIESYDVTTVRASTGHRLVTKYIKENSVNKCILSGEMADEIAGGYIYMKTFNSPNKFHTESCRLVEEIHFFDNLRSDRSISCNGLEGRVPFSDREFVNYYLNIPPELRMPSKNDGVEKYLLRKAFVINNDNDSDNDSDSDNALLPDKILWRPKVAFSDGVSSNNDGESWHSIIQKWLDCQITDEEFENKKNSFDHIKPYSKEAYYYRKIWNKYYKTIDCIPHYWQPRNEKGTIISNDPSARELKDIYKE